VATRGAGALAAALAAVPAAGAVVGLAMLNNEGVVVASAGETPLHLTYDEEDALLPAWSECLGAFAAPLVSTAKDAERVIYFAAPLIE
jgi:hypothetical protein